MAGARLHGLELTPPQKERLNEALRSTFSPSRLEYVFEYRLGRELHTEFSDSYPSMVQGVVREAAGEGWVDELVARAREAAPGSVALRDIAEELGLAAEAPPREELQRLVAHDELMMAPEEWRSRMAVLETQICRVEVGPGGRLALGTGFLVGPRTVMTNHHVVKRALGGGVPVTLRFDYKRAATGDFASDGSTFEMADAGVVDSSPPAESEFASSNGAAPTHDELDYALIDVAGDPGKRPVGNDTGTPNPPLRGWIEPPPADRLKLPARGRTVFILQHPSGDPIKQAFGPIGDSIHQGARVQHAVNTLKGSSGSPVFDANLNLVALHHAGDPLYHDVSAGQGNRAVPLDAILAGRERRRLPRDLGAAA